MAGEGKSYFISTFITFSSCLTVNGKVHSFSAHSPLFFSPSLSASSHSPPRSASAHNATLSQCFHPIFLQRNIYHLLQLNALKKVILVILRDKYYNTVSQVLGNSAIQRKKSLPDVAALPTVTVKQGSQAMTREEISVLSSARREEIRRQLEEAERYRANPVLYILNPHIRVSLQLVQRMFQNSCR